MVASRWTDKRYKDPRWSWERPKPPKKKTWPKPLSVYGIPKSQNMRNVIRLYTNPKLSTFLNMKKSVEEWYENGKIMTKWTMAQITNTLNHHPQVQRQIKLALERQGLDDNSVSEEHAKLVMQDKDLWTKLGAIKEYHKIMGNYAPTQVENKSMNMNIDISDEQFAALLKQFNNSAA